MSESPWQPSGPTPSPGIWPPFPSVPPLKYSGLGIASLVIALVAGFSELVLVGYAGYLEATTPGGMDEDSVTAVMVGLSMLAAGLGSAFGLALGIGGIVQKDRKNLFAILGVVFNAFVLLGTVLLVVIGIAMS